MGLRLAILGSGSSGNCALLRSEGTTVLIDMGFSARKTQQLLKTHDLALSQIDAILITHEHGDHTAGLSGLAKYGNPTVYANRATARVLEPKLEHPLTWRHFETGTRFTIGDLEIESVSVPHDAQDPVGFLIRATSGGSATTLGWLTDMGHIPGNIASRLHEMDTLSIEANHCHEMLANDTKRPWSLRQRIGGRHGHLSNLQLVEALAAVPNPRWRKLYLTHLSRDCNRPELVKATLAAQPFCQNCEVVVVGPDEATPLSEL